MKHLVLIHGRSQQDQDPATLKKTWIATWKRGLDKNGLQIPIDESRIHFPYFGDAFRDLTQGMSVEEAAKIIVMGSRQDSKAETFYREVLQEYLEANGISSDEIEGNVQPADPMRIVEQGAQNWGWVQAVLRTLDDHNIGSATIISEVTNDVYQYITNPRIQGPVDAGVLKSFDKTIETVVVSHSLGTIVAYKLLQAFSHEGGWNIPLLVTLGSPLGIKAIRSHLRPINHPSCVGEWFNARDKNDVVALNPLDAEHFDVTPAIENKSDVHNHTDNKHGIEGYLDDKEVAKRIYDALQ